MYVRSEPLTRLLPKEEASQSINQSINPSGQQPLSRSITHITTTPTIKKTKGRPSNQSTHQPIRAPIIPSLDRTPRAVRPCFPLVYDGCSHQDRHDALSLAPLVPRPFWYSGQCPRFPLRSKTQRPPRRNVDTKNGYYIPNQSGTIPSAVYRTGEILRAMPTL